MSAEIVHLDARRAAADLDAQTAWAAFVAAKMRADATLNLRDMAAAVRAYEAMLQVLIPDARQRREVWP